MSSGLPPPLQSPPPLPQQMALPSGPQMPPSPANNMNSHASPPPMARQEGIPSCGPMNANLQQHLPSQPSSPGFPPQYGKWSYQPYIGLLKCNNAFWTPSIEKDEEGASLPGLRLGWFGAKKLQPEKGLTAFLPPAAIQLQTSLRKVVKCTILREREAALGGSNFDRKGNCRKEVKHVFLSILLVFKKIMGNLPRTSCNVCPWDIWDCWGS